MLSKIIKIPIRNSLNKIVTFLESGDSPKSILNERVSVGFFITSPENKNEWNNDRTGQSGFYGKVIPEFIVGEKRSVIPIIGNLYDVEEFNEDQDAVILKKLTDNDICERFGLIRMRDEDGELVSAEISSLSTVGRLGFSFGDGGYVLAKCSSGNTYSIDSSIDFLDSLIAGREFSFVNGRFEIKGFGAKNTNIFSANNYELTDDTKIFIRDDGVNSVVDRNNLPAGIFFNTKYQIGFPSPSGTEKSHFSKETLLSEATFRAYGGIPAYHTFSRYSITDSLSGSFRFNTSRSDLHDFRIFEALEEYSMAQANGVPVDQTVLGSLCVDGLLKDKLTNMFTTIGTNMRSLHVLGKVWIILGSHLMHNSVESSDLNLNETYLFFLKNINLDGEQADFGDFLSFSDSLDQSHEDFYESLAITLVLVNQVLTDFENMGIIPSQWKGGFLRAFLRSFMQNDSIDDQIDIESLCSINLDNLIYREVERTAIAPINIYEDLRVKYKTYVRDNISIPFKSTVDFMFQSLFPLLDYWPVRDFRYGSHYIHGQGESTSTRRFTPFDHETIQGQSYLRDLEYYNSTENRWFSKYDMPQKSQEEADRFNQMQKDLDFFVLNSLDFIGTEKFSQEGYDYSRVLGLTAGVEDNTISPQEILFNLENEGVFFQEDGKWKRKQNLTYIEKNWIYGFNTLLIERFFGVNYEYFKGHYIDRGNIYDDGDVKSIWEQWDGARTRSNIGFKALPNYSTAFEQLQKGTKREEKEMLPLLVAFLSEQRDLIARTGDSLSDLISDRLNQVVEAAPLKIQDKVRIFLELSILIDIAFRNQEKSITYNNKQILLEDALGALNQIMNELN